VIAETVLALVSAERSFQLALSARNTRRLRALGAVEVHAGEFAAILALQAAWLASLWLYAPGRPVVWPALALYALLQCARAWTLATLGRRWTARVVVVPGERLIEGGPYRYVAHPNYVVLALEIPTLALAFSMPLLALAFGLANLALLAWRIRIEERALSPLRGPKPSLRT